MMNLKRTLYFPNKKPILEANKIISREKEYALPEQKIIHNFLLFILLKVALDGHSHSIAFAKKLNDSKKKVLLIDGDFEAPGISYLMFNESSPDISYKDLLALVHSDVDDKGLNAIKFVADRILSQVKENIFILPAFRNEENLLSLEIKPIDLTNNFSNPYILSEIIFLLGKSLNVDVVIVDLRAGLSELSSGLLLDPRVEKILVSSYSEQSLKGIEQVLKLLKERHTKEIGKNPSLILTQIPDNELKDVDKLFKKKYNLSSAFFGNKNIYDNEEPLDFELKFIESPFNQELVVLPLVWDEVIAKIKKSNLDHTISNLIEYHNIPSILGTKQNYDYQNLRKQLKEKTEKMILQKVVKSKIFYGQSHYKILQRAFLIKCLFWLLLEQKVLVKHLFLCSS
jgi:cellulose biosynthesis protein BcsQ